MRKMPQKPQKTVRKSVVLMTSHLNSFKHKTRVQSIFRKHFKRIVQQRDRYRFRRRERKALPVRDVPMHNVQLRKRHRVKEPSNGRQPDSFIVAIPQQSL